MLVSTGVLTCARSNCPVEICSLVCWCGSPIIHSCISLQGRTTVRTRDAAGVEETRETLHGLTQSQAEAFDAEWLARSRPSGSGDKSLQIREQLKSCCSSTV